MLCAGLAWKRSPHRSTSTPLNGLVGVWRIDISHVSTRVKVSLPTTDILSITINLRFLYWVDRVSSFFDDSWFFV